MSLYVDSELNHNCKGYPNCQNVFENIPLFIKNVKLFVSVLRQIKVQKQVMNVP